jgi:hypothetical protein
MRLRIGGLPLISASVLDLAGDIEGAERELAQGIAILREIGETGVLSTLAAMRATALYRLGRLDEMAEMIRLAQETGAPNDIATQAEWRATAARAAADDRRLGEAGVLSAEAVALVEPTDFLELRGRVFEGQAHVEARAGRQDGWRRALERALAEHERKANLVRAARVREQLAAAPPAAAST